MGNNNSNYPTAKLNDLNGTAYVSETVNSLRELADRGKPNTLEELNKRIDDYFAFCEQRAFRPGIESLCLSLSVTRQTLWNWRQGNGCAEEWADSCNRASQLIIAFIEAASLSGHLNPATACFSLKNWANYSDAQAVEIITEPKKEALSTDMLPKFVDGVLVSRDAQELPVLSS